MKGYSAEEVLGRHFSMFYARGCRLGEPERLLEQAAREGRAEREAWRVRKDGGRIWANEVVTAVRDAEGRLVGFTKISRDQPSTARWRRRRKGPGRRADRPGRGLREGAHIPRAARPRRPPHGGGPPVLGAFRGA